MGLSRRHFSTLLAASALACLAAAGCGDARERTLAGMPEFCREVLPAVADHMAGFPHPTGERYGGTAVVGIIAEIQGGMNSLISADYAANQHQRFVLFMSLVELDENLELEPRLARSWEVNEDGTEITFRLRDDVRWHDGTPVRAEDVEFTYLRATDPATGFPNAAYFRNYVPGPEGIEVLDPLTVRVRLRPHAEYLDVWRTMTIMPRHLLGEVAPGDLRTHPFNTRCPVGNGPFVFVENRPDESWTFERNPAFPEELGGPPYLERYVLRVIPEPTTRLTELLTGTLDVLIQPSPDQAPRILAAEGTRLLEYPTRQYVFVGWNTRLPQLADARVRRAITLATDRRQVVDGVLRGYGRLANAGVPPFHWGHLPGIEDSLAHDPDEARRLLDEAGWTDPEGTGTRRNADGTPLEFTLKYHPGSVQRQAIAEIMQAQLAEVGIVVRPQVVEWVTLVGQITNPDSRDFEGVVMSWVPEFKVDDSDLFHSERRESMYAWAGLEDPRLDRLLDALQLVLDREEASPLWHEYQRLLLELQPYTYVYFPQGLSGVRDRLQDVRMDARGEWVGITDWWIPSDRRGR